MMALSAALMLTACGEHESEIDVKVQQPEPPKEKTITFTFGDVRADTRATLQEMNITDLWLFDYVGDGLLQTIHKTEGFDALTLSMDYGEHTLCFVASRGSEPTVTAPTVSWAKPSDTFWATVTMDVQPASSASHQVTLRRVATRLRISVTDEIPAEASTLSVTPSVWYYGLNVMTGEGTDARQTERTVTIPASYVGTSGQLTASFFGLSPSESWQTDIAVAMKDADGTVLGAVMLEDVGFGRNVTTSYSGGLIGAWRSVTMDVDDAWGDESIHEW